MERDKIIDVSGAYSGNSYPEISTNIQEAREFSIKIWELGAIALCPHLNTSHFEIDCKCGYEDFMRGDFEIIKRCDGIHMLPNWHHSRGAIREHTFAEGLPIPIFYNLSDLEKWLH